MEALSLYIKQCIKPINNTEYCVCDDFDSDIFKSMKQDGIMICTNLSVDSKRKLQVNHTIEGGMGGDNPPSEYLSIGNYGIVKKCYRNIEWLDETDNTFHFDPTKLPIYRRLLPPPDETVNHTHIIQCVISELAIQINNPVYIEYGVRWSTTLNVISNIVYKSYGIDINDIANVPENCTFYKCTTDEFSNYILRYIKFHFAFIDADHKFESCLEDFKNIFKYIEPNGIIFLHDTYPCEARFLDKGACNDCYKTPLAIKKLYGDKIEIVTLPLNPGLTIIKKIGNQGSL